MTFQLFSKKMSKFYLGISKKKVRTKMLRIDYPGLVQIEYILLRNHFIRFTLENIGNID